MRTVQQVMAKVNRDIAAGLVRSFEAMPADKQTWSPLDEGRSALNMMAESAVINRFGARVLRERAVPAFEGEAFGAAVGELETAEKAVAALRESAEDLASAIESLPDQALESTVQFPWDDKPSTLSEATLMAYWNMVYHLGQINYVQTLYGDREMH